MHKATITFVAASALREFHGALAQSEQGVVFATADVLAGMEMGATLANDDVAGDDVLAAVALHAQSLSMRVAAVTGGAKTFFMSHE